MRALLSAATLFWSALCAAQNFVGITTSASPITISLACSQSSGTAPVPVFCSAVGTTATGVTRPFHDLEYRWDFGDTVAGAAGTCGAVVAGEGSFACGSRSPSKNLATGPVAAHVFENAGTKTITLTVFDGTNTNITTRAVAVTAADTTYSTTNTICASPDSTPSGGADDCPTGATGVQQSNIATLFSTYATDGKRLLLRRGKTWTGCPTLAPTGTAGGIVGAYGSSGAAPKWTCTSAAGLTVSSCSTSTFAKWTVQDVEIDGTGGGSNGIDFSGRAQHFTLLRVNVHDFSSANVGFGKTALAACTPDHDIHDGLFVHDSAFDDSGNNSLIGDVTRGSFQGNSITDETVGFGFRVSYWDKLVFSNNTVTNTVGGVTIRATDYIAGEAPVPPGSVSQYGVFADNKLSGGANAQSGSPLIAFRPVDSSHDERVDSVVVERNWMLAVANVGICVNTSATNVTIRNNLCDMTGGSSGWNAFNTGRLGIEPSPTGIRHYNNTVSGNSNIFQPTCLRYNTMAMTVANEARNNVCYVPTTITGTPTIETHSSSDVTASNNSTSFATNPTFVAFPWVTPASAQASGYPVDGGASVPVWSDFGRNPIGTTRDLGAWAAP